jgi:hypothetical protein
VCSSPTSASGAKDAAQNEEGDDGDDLTAENDAIDVHRWAPSHSRAVDDVDAGRLGGQAEPAARPGSTPGTVRSTALTVATAASSTDRGNGNNHGPGAPRPVQYPRARFAS